MPTKGYKIGQLVRCTYPTGELGACFGRVGEILRFCDYDGRGTDLRGAYIKGILEDGYWGWEHFEPAEFDLKRHISYSLFNGSKLELPK